MYIYIYIHTLSRCRSKTPVPQVTLFGNATAAQSAGLPATIGINTISAIIMY